MSYLQWTIEHKFLTHFMLRAGFNIITRLNVYQSIIYYYQISTQIKKYD